MRPGSGRSIDLLVDEKKIADEQRALHRGGWNAEGLDDEGEDEERDGDDARERLQCEQDACVVSITRCVCHVDGWRSLLNDRLVRSHLFWRMCGAVAQRFAFPRSFS